MARHSLDERAFNLAGTCMAHFDPSGANCVTSIALTGHHTSVSRQFLADDEMGAEDVEVDWAGEDGDDWSASGQKLCEAHGNGIVRHYTYDPQTRPLIGLLTEQSGRPELSGQRGIALPTQTLPLQKTVFTRTCGMEMPQVRSLLYLLSRKRVMQGDQARSNLV